MMTNLFSTFDPSTSLSTTMNWMSMFIIIMMMPSTFWVIPSRHFSLTKITLAKVNLEVSALLSKPHQKTSIMFTTLFALIMVNNLMGLIPYIFTGTSHLAFSMTLALPAWMSLMLFGWIYNTKHMLAHLIPEGSPPLLMPFMVCIETISNLIRPGSLAVRLAANMIAGHLLMSLLGNNTNPLMLPLIMAMQIMLMMFESAVSIIQAYVFSILSTLYSSEVTYENK